MIEVDGLTVHFGGVTPLDDVTVSFLEGTCGLIGPNGAGKTTFFNVLSGFVTPATGARPRIRRGPAAMADYRRARWGLRRTFQPEQAIEELSVFDNVAMIHEHSRAGRRSSRQHDVHEALAFVGLEAIRRKRSAVSAPAPGASSRLARAVVGKPRVVLLDEPAAGLPDEETEQLGKIDPGDSRAVRGAGDPRRPRHDPRLGLLRDDGGARLRQADRLRADGRGAPRRARHPRLPRYRGHEYERRGHAESRCVSRASRPRGGRDGRARRLARDPARRGHDPARRRTAPASRRSCSRSAGVLRPTAGRCSSATRTSPAAARADPPGRCRGRPRGAAAAPRPHRGGQPAGRDVLAQRARRRGRHRLRARALPGARSALECAGRSLSGGEQQMVVLAQALVSRPKVLVVDELSLGLAPVVVKRLVPTLAAVARVGRRASC